MSSDTPEPFDAFASPNDAEDSGRRKLSVREARMLLDAQRETAKAERRVRSVKTWLLTSSAAVLATVSALAWGQSKLDAGTAAAVAPVELRVGKVESEVGAIKSQLATVQSTGIRSEAMLEMLLANRGLPLPPKMDGGQ